MRTAMKAGKTPGETAAIWKISDKYKGYTIAEPRLKTNVQVLYDELKK
jgi:hypothetical protein